MTIDFQLLLPALQNKLSRRESTKFDHIQETLTQKQQKKILISYFLELTINQISDIIILLADIPCSLLVKGSDEHLNTKVTTC